MFQHLAQSPLERFLIQQVADTDAPAGCFVHESGSYTLEGGAYSSLASCLLFQSVEQDVIGHNQVSAVADKEIFYTDIMLLEGLYLAEKCSGVDNNTVADEA